MTTPLSISPAAIDDLNARTGLTWRRSEKSGNSLVRALFGRAYLYLSDQVLMVGFNDPCDATIVINEGDLESSMPWLLDMGRTMARVRGVLAEMLEAVDT